jgi:hypothetical protein
MSSILDSMQHLALAWPVGAWSWDGRFSCASSSFGAEHEAKARAAIVAGSLGTEWTMTTLAEAPPAVRDLAARTGGLRAGQLLFTGAELGPTFVFGLWWPWGNGSTISLRIGLAGSDVQEEQYRSLAALFGIAR